MSNTYAFPSSLPAVPLTASTRASVEGEVAAMGPTESPTALPDLVADAHEILAARADIPELVARGYPVTEALIDRISLLLDMSQTTLVLRALDRAATVPTYSARAEANRVRLLDIRRELGLKAAAAGLPSDLFVYGSGRSSRLNVVLMRVGQVLGHAQRLLDRFADRERVTALIAEGQALVAAEYDQRAEAGLKRAEGAGDTQRQERLERLLLDALIYLSRQGKAAFFSDPLRSQKYELDHIYGVKPSRVGDPGAGGTTGYPDARPEDDGPLVPAAAANA